MALTKVGTVPGHSECCQLPLVYSRPSNLLCLGKGARAQGKHLLSTGTQKDVGLLRGRQSPRKTCLTTLFQPSLSLEDARGGQPGSALTRSEYTLSGASGTSSGGRVEVTGLTERVCVSGTQGHPLHRGHSGSAVAGASVVVASAPGKLDPAPWSRACYSVLGCPGRPAHSTAPSRRASSRWRGGPNCCRSGDHTVPWEAATWVLPLHETRGRRGCR